MLNIDYGLLADQKEELVRALHTNTQPDANVMLGVIYLLDNLQDEHARLESRKCPSQEA